jgi:multiple sugar transport system substrate-binding protein
MEAGAAAFELNYPFVYPSMQTDKPDVKSYNGKSLAENFKWAQYPRVKPNLPSRVTIGGINLAISSYSNHANLAFKAALCLRNRANQLVAAVKGGLPPTLEALYTHPPKSFVQGYPMYKAIYASLKTASVRPLTPAYQSVSIVISHALSPPGGQDPESVVNSLHGQINDALQSKGLIP